MFDMLGKLQEIKKSMDEIKARLETISVEGRSGNGSVLVHMNGNRVVKEITIDPSLMESSRKEELEELLETAINDAGEKARQVSESEMKAAGKGLLPDIPGLF